MRHPKERMTVGPPHAIDAHLWRVQDGRHRVWWSCSSDGLHIAKGRPRENKRAVLMRLRSKLALDRPLQYVRYLGICGPSEVAMSISDLALGGDDA